MAVCASLVLFFSFPLLAVWVSALDGSPWVCILLSDSPSVISFSLYVWFFSYNFCLLCLPGFIVPHLETLCPAAYGITSPPAHHLCLPLPDLCGLPGSTALHFSLTSRVICASHLHPPCLLCLVTDRHQVTSDKSVCWQKYPQNIPLQRNCIAF